MNVTFKKTIGNFNFFPIENQNSKKKRKADLHHHQQRKKYVDKFYDVVWILHFYFITLFFHLDHIGGDQNNDNGVCIRLINFFYFKATLQQVIFTSNLKEFSPRITCVCVSCVHFLFVCLFVGWILHIKQKNSHFFLLHLHQVCLLSVILIHLIRFFYFIYLFCRLNINRNRLIGSRRRRKKRCESNKTTSKLYKKKAKEMPLVCYIIRKHTNSVINKI